MFFAGGAVLKEDTCLTVLNAFYPCSILAIQAFERLYIVNKF